MSRKISEIVEKFVYSFNQISPNYCYLGNLSIFSEITVQYSLNTFLKFFQFPNIFTIIF